MENNIVLFHLAFAVLFVLYLLVRLLISLFGVSDKEYQAIMRRRFRISDWIFIAIIIPTGLYPIVVLGQIELYHLIKIILVAGMVYLMRFNHTLNFAGTTLLILLMVGVSGYTSFSDSPKFPKKQGTFEKDHPEVAGMSVLGKGEVIFNVKCAQCHGRDGKLRRFQAADLTKSTLDLDQKIETVKNGVRITVMRSFEKELSPEEIVAVATYAHQLSR